MFITHLCWLVGGATMLVAAKDAVEVVHVAGSLGAAVVVASGTVEVLLVWLLD